MYISQELMSLVDCCKYSVIVISSYMDDGLWYEA